MTNLTEGFCEWQRSYNKVSEDRVERTRRLIGKLEASLDGRPITSLNSGDLERFLIDCNVSPASTLKHLRMLRPFLKWMWRQKAITAEQLLDLKEVRAPRGASWSQPRPYTRAQIAEFWEDFDDAFPWTTDTDIRNQTPYRAEFWVRRWQRGASDWRRVWPYARRLQAEAIVALALFGGLRRIEIFNLTLENMHYDNAYVRVTGARKNPAGKPIERGAPMTPQLRLALANWLEFRDQVLQPPHEQPWLTLWRERYLQPMTLDGLGRLLDRVGDGYELHRMRHTFATERWSAGMPVEVLQRVMGHADIAMTLRYARITVDDAVRVADSTNDDFTAAVVRSHA